MPGSPVLQPSAVPLLFKSSPSSMACPALLRAALRGEGGRGRCCCSATAMPVVTDLEYDALIMGQPPQSHQILVVCVTPPCQPVSTCSEFDLDVLDQLYRRMNSHRAAPCTQVHTLFLLQDLDNLVPMISLPSSLFINSVPMFLCLMQCQLDSFRLVRYQMPTGMFSWDLENSLLHRRHNAAPGMFLVSRTSAGCRLCSVHSAVVSLGGSSGSNPNCPNCLQNSVPHRPLICRFSRFPCNCCRCTSEESCCFLASCLATTATEKGIC